MSIYYPLTCLSDDDKCQCGGARNAHASVALGDYFSTAIVNLWNSSQHSSEYPTDAFGEVQFAGASKRHSYVGVFCQTDECSCYCCVLSENASKGEPNTGSSTPRNVVSTFTY